jgi:hypothetical protein
MFGLNRIYPSEGIFEVFTLKLQATKHATYATSPQSLSLSASSSTDQKPCTALYLSTKVLP